MAQNYLNVLLGFEDELIQEKHQDVVSFTTNKIGGKPDWPLTDSKATICPLCELPRPLVIQIYVPLENCSFHRTLYLFACINPNCWNQNESWICLRSQIPEQLATAAEAPPVMSVTDWCQDADDWDDETNANTNEENGNLINAGRVSDDEEESCSFEEVRAGFGQLTVDERNANTGAFGAEVQGGAVGRQSSPTASAEIEGDESELVTIDTPVAPQNDLAALLQEVAALPQELCQRSPNDITQFIPQFISVAEEATGGSTGTTDHHIRDLLQEYQLNNEELVYEQEESGSGVEKYEKSVPAHGDKMFHYFLSRIQMNPGQILRYSRNGSPPLLLQPLQDVPKTCKHCQGDLIFEFQLLPTIIPRLRLQGVKETTGSRLEFGTVLVFTCKRSCWQSDTKIREECVLVQSEK